MTAAAEVKERYEARLMRMRGVVGIGIGQTNGREVIRIYVNKDTPKVRAEIPRALEDVPVEVVVTGTFRAL